MQYYISGNYIRTLRERKGYTQKRLAEELAASDKTISKGETEKGLPDITVLESLAKALNVSLVEV